MMNVSTTAGDPSVTPFKQAQLRHRRRGDDPNRIDDLKEWIDFGRSGDNRIVPLVLPGMAPDLSNIYNGPIFGLRDFPGFMFAPQAIDEDCQTEIAFQSVSTYCETPHNTNIDQCPPKPNETVTANESMWTLYKKEYTQRKTLNNVNKKQKVGPTMQRPYRSFQKLSWACMGYHYDWTERSYHEGAKSEMPSLVQELSVLFARTSLLLQNKDSASVLKYTPSASIVNFYTTKSIMGGHRDDLEFTMEKPIVSLSIGLPAIFLLGGKTKEDKPVVPILIRKGDVLCMGGDSRLNYHGMARLIPLESLIPKAEEVCCPNQNEIISLKSLGYHRTNMSEEDTDALKQFLTNHRINLNVRQVHPDDVDKSQEAVH